MKRRKHASCMTSDFENDKVLRTKRPSRWRKVRFHRSTCAVWPDSLPLGCAVLRAARLNRLPRNPCSSGRGDTRRESLPTSGGKSSGCDLQSRKQPLDIITFAGILYLPLGGFLLARCFVGLT